MKSDEGWQTVLHPGGGAVYVIMCNDTLLNTPWADEAGFCLSAWSSSSWDVSCLIVIVYIHKAASLLNICKLKATVIIILILKMHHVTTLKWNKSPEVKRQKKIITCSRLFTRLAAGLLFCFGLAAFTAWFPVMAGSRFLRKSTKKSPFLFYLLSTKHLSD